MTAPFDPASFQPMRRGYQPQSRQTFRPLAPSSQYAGGFSSKPSSQQQGQGGPQDQQGQGPAPTPGMAPTFAQLQAAGVARPAPPTPQMAGPYNPAAPGFNPALHASVAAGLANPSGYGSDVVQGTYNRLSQSIDDDYAQRTQGTNEEMARRGLYDSTEAAGRLHDLNVGKRSAKTELAGQLLDRQAQQLQTDRASAIAAALGVAGQEGSQDLARYNANVGAVGQNNAAQMQASGFGEQQYQSDVGNRFQGQSLGLQRRALDQQYGIDQQRFSLEQALGLGNLDLNRGQLDLARTGQAQNYDLANRQFGLSRDLGLGNLGIAQGELGVNQQRAANDLSLGNNANLLQLLSILNGLNLSGDGSAGDAGYGADYGAAPSPSPSANDARPSIPLNFSHYL